MGGFVMGRESVQSVVAAAGLLSFVAICAIPAVTGCGHKSEDIYNYDWSASFDGPPSRVHQLPDGDYIVYGAYNENMLLRTDSQFRLKWTNSYDSLGGDLTSVLATADGGFLLSLGYNDSTSLIKTDASGSVVWRYDIPGLRSGYSSGGATCLTADGGYVTAGSCHDRIKLVKLAADRKEQWHAWRDSGLPRWIAQTSDHGYLVGSTGPCWVDSNWGFYELPDRIWRYDSLGKVVWSRSLGDANVPISEVEFACVTPEGECMILDYSHRLVEFDTGGKLKWWKDIECGDGWLVSVQPTSDGGFILAGSASDSTSDVLLVKTDSLGTKEWSSAFGIKGVNEYGTWAEQTAGSGYILAGFTSDEHDQHYTVRLKKTDANGN
jgi:hypothetical protein